MKIDECFICGSSNFIRKGFRYTQRKGILQRYKCKDCSSHFQENWEDISRHRVPYGIIDRIMELHHNKKYSLRRIAKLVQLSHVAVSNIIKNRHEIFGIEQCKKIYGN